MSKHHRDRDRDMMDDTLMRDPRMSDPRGRDSRMSDPRMRDPRTRDPRGGSDPRAAANPSVMGSTNNVLGTAGNALRSIAGTINFGELLKGIDINQIIGLVTSLTGVNNMTTGQLGSMLRNLDLSDLGKGPMPASNMNVTDMKSQLSTLADKLEQMGNGQNNSVQDELLKAINTLQQSPELMGMFNNFVNATMPKTPNKE